MAASSTGSPYPTQAAAPVEMWLQLHLGSSMADVHTESTRSGDKTVISHMRQTKRGGREPLRLLERKAGQKTSFLLKAAMPQSCSFTPAPMQQKQSRGRASEVEVPEQTSDVKRAQRSATGQPSARQDAQQSDSR